MKKSAYFCYRYIGFISKIILTGFKRFQMLKYYMTEIGNCLTWICQLTPVHTVSCLNHRVSLG